MSQEDEAIRIFFLMILVGVGALVVAVVLNFLTSSQTGNIAGYPVTMPGVAWLGVPVVGMITLILYVKNRM